MTSRAMVGEDLLDAPATLVRPSLGPNHNFVRGKPHPNGIKVTTLADQSTYLYSLKICRRAKNDKGEANDPTLLNHKNPTWDRGPLFSSKKVHKLATSVTRNLPGSRHVYGDSYYGGIQVLEALHKQGHQGTYTCTAIRPAGVFKELKAKLSDFGSYASCSGVSQSSVTLVNVRRRDGDEDEESGSEDSDDELPDSMTLTFAGVAFQAARPMYLLSTGHPAGSTVMSTETDSMEDREVQRRILVPTARKEYTKRSGYVDEANDAILQHRFPHRFLRWKACLGGFFLRVLVHNSRVLFMASHGNISTTAFMTSLCTTLAPVRTRSMDHQLKSQGAKNADCFICYKSGHRNKTTLKCTTCNKWIHRGCFNSPHHRM